MTKRGIRRFLRRHTFARFVVSGAGLVAVLASLWLVAHSLGSSKTIPIYFRSPSGALTVPLEVEVADSEPLRQKGLMFRRELKPDHGMLFIFPDNERRTFWMRNTYLSLDMIFVNEAKKVVTVLRGVPILNDAPRSSSGPAKYVVELPAGNASALGVDVGWELHLPDR